MNTELLQPAGATEALGQNTAVSALALPATASGRGLRPAARPASLSAPKFGVMLALLIAGAFPAVLFGSQSFFYRDFALFGYPLAAYHKAAFWRGELPFWNPLNNCGLPFLAQWNTLTLYPGSLIYLLLPLPWSLSLFNLVHLWVAGMGMFLLARRWTDNSLAAGVAGVAYGLNGLMLHSLMWPNNIAALAWMPWLVGAMNRAVLEGGTRVFVAGLVGAIQMLSGAPEMILFSWIISGAAGVWAIVFGDHRPLSASAEPNERVNPLLGFGRLMTVGGLTAALSAAQLLPFLDLLAHSHRTSSFGGSEWSMPLWGWANFFVPLFHCSKAMIGVYTQDAQQWTSSYYVGVGTIALALLAWTNPRRRHVWLLTVITLLGVWLAFGSQGGLLPILKGVVPGLGLARYPIKFIVLPVFALPLLAAWGVATLGCCGSKSSWAPQAPRNLAMVGSGVALLIGALVWVADTKPALGEQVGETLLNAVNRTVFLMLLVGGLVAAHGLTSESVRRWLEWACVILLGVDLLTHSPHQNPTLPVAALRPTAVDHSAMPRLGQGRAMITPRVHAFLAYAGHPDPLTYHLGHQRTLLGNLNLLDGIPKVNGFFSLYLANEASVSALFSSANQPVPTGLLDFMGVTKISAPIGWFEWTNRPTALPFITAGQEPVFADQAGTLVALGAPEFRPSETVLLPDAARGACGVRGRADVRLANTTVSAQRITVEASATAPTILVLAQSYYHRWRAFIDEQPVRLWPANGAFQAIALPAGAHRIRVDYEDPNFRTGAAISASTFLAGLGFTLRQRTARRRIEIADARRTNTDTRHGMI